MTSLPLWASAFRPFYFLGAPYAVLLVAAWLGAYLGLWTLPAGEVPLKLLHGHEFIFGFAAAIITGIVLTALPSWAGTEEIRGGRLMLLVALWLFGRIAFWASPWLPPPLYYHGLLTGNHAQAGAALRLAIYAIIVLYVLKGGVLAPIFTGNALREKGCGGQAPFDMKLEVASLASLLALAACDLGAAPRAWTGSMALACALLYGWRTWRWQGWRVADVPLVLVMHLGFAWLVFAFALKAAAELTGLVPEAAWLHAFTVGSLGLMMLGLMTRVSLRHTGRPLVVPGAMLAAYVLMFVAAVLRLAATVHGLGNEVIVLSAGLWAAAFALYFMVFWKALVTPSAPRRPQGIPPPARPET